MLRPRSTSLLIRLLASYLLTTLTLFSLFGWLVYRATASSLEQSLGRRLIGIAQASATQLPPASIHFLSPGDEESRTGQRVRQKLVTLRERTHVARLYVLDHELRLKSDTDPGTRIGDHHYHAEADRLELQRVFAGEPASSVLFRGSGGKYYKTGYAPVLDESLRPVAAVGVEGSAEFFSVLASLRNTLALSGLGVALLVMFVSVLVARRITRPLRLLAHEAERIGMGELERPIPVQSSGEVELLARTMNEMREGLFQRDQQLQMMLSGIAHEVRNPLGGIELFSGILRDELAGDPEKLEHVGRIERELGYLERVVREFLDYARRSSLTLARIDGARLLEEIAELMAKDAEDAGVTLRCALERPVWVRGDTDQLRRAVINLVRNAIQATPEGRAVTLRCAAAGRIVTLVIEDEGGGVEPELAEKIFTPFFTTREKGTGLGLAFAKKITDEHGGELTVQSEPGRGARFTLTLPGDHIDGHRTDH